MYILDTEIVSNPAQNRQVSHWLANKAEAEIYISALSIGAFQKDIAQRRLKDTKQAQIMEIWVERTVSVFGDRILSFTAEDARIWGQLSKANGTEDISLMIAAQALNRDAVFVTLRAGRFEATNLRTENPLSAV